MSKPADKTSIWKKEITFRKTKPEKSHEAKAKPEKSHEAPAQSEETSVWKKEITFRRKPKAEQGHRWPPRSRSSRKALRAASAGMPGVRPTSSRSRRNGLRSWSRRRFPRCTSG